MNCYGLFWLKFEMLDSVPELSFYIAYHRKQLYRPIANFFKCEAAFEKITHKLPNSISMRVVAVIQKKKTL